MQREQVFSLKKYKTRFLRKSMIDRALESVSAPYKLAMRILLFFLMSSVAQLEAEIATGRGVFKKNYNPYFFSKYKVEKIITSRASINK